MLFRIQWKLALVVALTIPLFLFVIMTMRRSMSAASKESKQKTGHINSEIETSLSGITELPFGAFCALMQPIHLAIGLVEGLITAAVLCFVTRIFCG